MFQAVAPPSAPRALFEDKYEDPQSGAHTGYDVFPDGRFLMIQSAAQQSSPHESIILVYNWTGELKRQIRAGSQ